MATETPNLHLVKPGASDFYDVDVQNDNMDIIDAAMAGKAQAEHTHLIAAINGLVEALAGKASATHTHAMTAITGLIDALAGKAASNHTQAISTITGLQTALDGKVGTNSNGELASLHISGAVAAGQSRVINIVFYPTGSTPQITADTPPGTLFLEYAP